MKRSLCLCVLLAVLLTAAGGLFPAVSAEKAAVRLYVQAASAASEAEAVRITDWYTSPGSRYLFLPACFDPDRLSLFFEGAETLTIGDRAYSSGDPVSFPLDEALMVSAGGNRSFTLTVMRSANIPAIFIETESGSMDAVDGDKGVKESGSMLLAGADGTVEYSGKLKYIRARGNSTFDYPKKPYQIKLESGSSLCGMAKDKTFVLLANYLDRSEIRNTIALDLARYSGAYAFTPACRSVDLYLNHAYAGCYLLTEKNEIDKNRLNITDLEAEMEKLNEAPLESFPFTGNKHYRTGATRSYEIPAEPDDITGGYLILANNTEYFQQEASGFVTNRGQAFTLQQPKYASTREIAYISGVMQEIENGLFAEDGRDPATGRHYSELLDMKSFVNRYLQSETLNDFDGQRPYFYKDSDAVDSMVYCGPVWDQDNILGASARRTHANYLSLDREQMRAYYWFTQAVSQPDFKAAMIETYYTVYRPAYLILLGEETDPAGILRSVDEYAEEILCSQRMDHIRWKESTWKEKSGGNPQAAGSPARCVSFIREFLRTHMKTMDKAYPRSGE